MKFFLTVALIADWRDALSRKDPLRPVFVFGRPTHKNDDRSLEAREDVVQRTNRRRRQHPVAEVNGKPGLRILFGPCLEFCLNSAGWHTFAYAGNESPSLGTLPIVIGPQKHARVVAKTLKLLNGFHLCSADRLSWHGHGQWVTPCRGNLERFFPSHACLRRCNGV